MATTLSQKLRIRENDFLLTIHAPADFKKKLEPLPTDVKISASGKNFQQIHWFVTNKE